MRLALPALLLGLALAGGARAQTVSTAQGREGELSAPAADIAVAAAPLSTAQQIDAWLADAPPPALGARAGAGPDGPWGDAEDDADGARFTRRVIPLDAPPVARTLADGQVHGEAGVEVGNLGWGGYGVVSGPLGKTGALQIGISRFEGNGGGRRWRGPRGGATSLNLQAAWSPGRGRGDDPRPIFTPTAPAY